MTTFLRTMRIITFCIAIFIVLLVVLFHKPFLKLLNISLHPNSVYDYIIMVAMICFFAYPLFFIITLIYRKATGSKIYWIYGKEEVSLFGQFRRYELWPFKRFLTDNKQNLSQDQTLKFPYSVDYGHVKGGYGPWYLFLCVVVKVYRFLRCVIILALIGAFYYFAAKFIAGGI